MTYLHLQMISRTGVKKLMEAICTQLLHQIPIIIGIITTLALIFNIGLFKFLNKWIEFKYTELEQKRYDIDTHLNITDDIELRLDKMIESCFQEYTITMLIYKTDWYITESDEIQINKDICDLVANRISHVFIKQLSLYYNEDSIYDIIAKRVYFKVTNFVIEHNKATPLKR